MANKKKTSTKSSTKSSTAHSSTGSSSSNKSGSRAHAGTTKSAADYFNPSQYFANPSQYFNKNTFTNFQPANVQSWVEQFIATTQKNLETLTACAQLAVEHAKDQMEEQAAFTSKLMQECASTFQETMTSGADPKDKMEEIADYTKYCLEKTATAARKAAETNIEAARKIGSTLSKRATDAVEELRSAA